MRAYKIALIVALAVEISRYTVPPLTGSTAASTQAPSSQPANQAITIIVSATAKDRTPILDLQKNEFHVFEGGHELPIVHAILSQSQPYHIGLLLDVGANQADHKTRNYQQVASDTFKELLRPENLGFVAAFSREVKLLCDSTDDQDALISSIEEACNYPARGNTEMYNSVYHAIQNQCHLQFFRGKESTALVILTGTSPLNSRSLIGPEGESAVRAAQKTGTVIYMLLFPPGGPWGPYYSALFRDKASKITEQTGGVTYSIGGDVYAADVSDRLAAHFQSLYSLRIPAEVLPQDGKFHAVKVKCTRPGVKISAQTGYYAPEKE